MRGLLIDGEFFLDQPGGSEAHAIVKKLHAKGVKVGLSIGYKAILWDTDEKEKQTIRRLKEIQLFEGSMTLFPMNDEAYVQAVKETLDDNTKPKTVTVVCSACGEKVMEITDPAEGALDASEPAAKATPKNEPPAETPTERIVREYVEMMRESFKKKTN